jgi:hypothetical protein
MRTSQESLMDAGALIAKAANILRKIETEDGEIKGGIVLNYKRIKSIRVDDFSSTIASLYLFAVTLLDESAIKSVDNQQ